MISIKEQSNHMIKKFSHLEEKIEENNQQLNQLRKQKVHQLLLEKHPYNLDKYANSYNDIAKALNISKSTVFNIAKEFGITRRNSDTR